MSRINLQAVVFDMGGVLLAVGNDFALPTDRLDWRGRQALLARLRREGGSVTLEELDRSVFQPWKEMYERRYELGREARWDPFLTALRRQAAVELSVEEMLEIWFRPYGETLEAVAGATAILEEVRRRGCKVGVVSNVPLPGRLYRGVLERSGLAASIDAMAFSYDAGSRKPSPAMLRGLLKGWAVPPQAAMMVGDRRGSDVACGRAAGVETVWLESDDGGGPEPDYRISRLSELRAILDQRI